MSSEVMKDIEELKKMGKDDATTIISTYHREILKTISDCTEKIKSIQKLSPAVVPVTNTAIVICEKDFMDKDGLNLCAVLGSRSDLVKMIDKLWDIMPEVMQEVAQKKGL